jgi:hypothetical protein
MKGHSFKEKLVGQGYIGIVSATTQDLIYTRTRGTTSAFYTPYTSSIERSATLSFASVALPVADSDHVKPVRPLLTTFSSITLPG